MIFDSIWNLDKYKKLIPGFELIQNFLKNNNLNEIEPGKYLVDGDKLYVVISHIKTQPEEERLWESHFKYADLQYVFSGKEVYGCTNVADLSNRTEVDAAKDIQFFDDKPEGGAWITVKPEEFVYFDTQDAHKPCCMKIKPGNVKKAIFKILL